MIGLPTKLILRMFFLFFLLGTRIVLSMDSSAYPFLTSRIQKTTNQNNICPSYNIKIELTPNRLIGYANEEIRKNVSSFLNIPLDNNTLFIPIKFDIPSASDVRKTLNNDFSRIAQLTNQILIPASHIPVFPIHFLESGISCFKIPYKKNIFQSRLVFSANEQYIDNEEKHPPISLSIQFDEHQKLATCIKQLNSAINKITLFTNTYGNEIEKLVNEQDSINYLPAIEQQYIASIRYTVRNRIINTYNNCLNQNLITQNNLHNPIIKTIPDNETPQIITTILESGYEHGINGYSENNYRNKLIETYCIGNDRNKKANLYEYIHRRQI
ncbi:MAG TPA: hypothetical protein VLB80_03955 [Candidatus Babeliales bacterium]|nr:hypothetical protein [Candidatus Babeliales bacterium]